jgi:hypothetical protein
MTLKQSFFDLMDHLGPTQPVSAMPPNAQAQDLVSLRHDIDHSLDVALEMAFWEHDRGLRATYYLLNSTDYWTNPDFDIKVRQLLDFGHEVGVHVNSVANWLCGTCASPEQDLRAALARLRGLGANADSTAAHGDKVCYQYGVTNFWMFSEETERADAKEATSAEGIPVTNADFQIHFPKQKTLIRSDGDCFTLGALALKDFGLSFLAHRAGWDRYFSDSGGGWTRSADPMDVPDIRSGRSMVLMHPIHWRAPARQIYILSPARSGSKWLSQVADRASSAMGLHEQTLNFRDEGGVFTASKRTHRDIDTLYEHQDEHVSLLRARRAWFDEQKGDVLECNVYLAPILGALKQLNPEAHFAALLRDPRQILVSLVNRGWYDTADDDKHPTIDVPGWQSLNQVEKAAHYIAHTRACIAAEAEMHFVDLVKLNEEPEALREFFVSLGLAFYPLLADPLLNQKLNENTIRDVAGFEALSEADQLRALEIIFGGEEDPSIYPSKTTETPLPNPRAFRKEMSEAFLPQFNYPFFPHHGSALGIRRGIKQLDSRCVKLFFRRRCQFTVPAGRNGTLMFGLPPAAPSKALGKHLSLRGALFNPGKAWRDWCALEVPVLSLKKADSRFDFPHSPERRYRLWLEGLHVEGLWQVMVQTFDAQGLPALLKRLVPELKAKRLDLSFKVPPSTQSLRVVLYAPNADQERRLSLSSASLEIAKILYEDVPVDGRLASRRVLILAHVGWSKEHGAPELASALARAGFGTVIWANFESTHKPHEALFVYSSGVNFLTLCPDCAGDSWSAIIEKIKLMHPDVVVDLDHAAPQSFRSACAQANINFIAGSQKTLVGQLVSRTKEQWTSKSRQQNCP